MKAENSFNSLASGDRIMQARHSMSPPARMPAAGFSFLLSAFCLPDSAFAASPSVTAALEPAEIRPGGFTTYTITIENGMPGCRLRIEAAQGSETTTSTPAFGQQTNIDNGAMRQASTLTWQISCTQAGEYVIPAQKLSVRG